MNMLETPEQRIPDLLPFLFSVIAHLHEIVAAAHAGLVDISPPSANWLIDRSREELFFDELIKSHINKVRPIIV
jgi:hypothetical protein